MVNHDFIPNSIFINGETPRLGVIVGIKTVESVMMDQEYFAKYRCSWAGSFQNLTQNLARGPWFISGPTQPGPCF